MRKRRHPRSSHARAASGYFIMSAIGSRITKPVPKRNTPSVTGSVAESQIAWRRLQLPPIALDAIAAQNAGLVTGHALCFCGLANDAIHKCHGHGPEKTGGSGPIHSL